MLRGLRLDETGEPLLLVDKDEQTRLRINASDWLEQGEAITSVITTAEGCEITTSTATPDVDLTIASVTYGKATLLISSTSGDTWRGVIRIRRRHRYNSDQPFRDYA